MDIRKVGRRYYQTYRKEDGSLFRGLMGKQPLTGRYTNNALGGVVMFTSPTENVEPGDLFFTQFNVPMLILDNIYEESLGPTQKCFTLKTMNRTLKWIRYSTKIDPVSGVEESSTEPEFEKEIYCSFEDDGKRSDTLLIDFAKYNLMTNKEVIVGDTLIDEWGNNFVVIRVDRYLGVFVINVQKR